jgi:hypothetical protein
MPYNLNDEEIPQSKRDWLYQKLMSGATRENTDAADLAAVQNQAAQQAAGLGVIEAGATIGKALAGGGPQGPATTQAQAANRQGLEDYLKRKQLERNAEYDKLQYVKELADLEPKPTSAGNVDLTQYVGIEGGKEVPMLRGPGGIGLISAVTGKPLADWKWKPMTQYQQLQGDLGQRNLDLRGKKYDLDVERFGWNKDMKTVDRANKIGKALTESGEPEFEGAKARVLSAMARFNQDIPGKGRLGSILPTYLNTDEGQKFKADIQALITPIRKGYYGSALTATELKNFEDMTATGKGYSEEAFKYALNQLIVDKESAINSVKARDPDAYKIYEQQRQGMFVKSPAGQPTSAAPSTMSVDKKKRLEELRAKKAAGTLK